MASAPRERRGRSAGPTGRSVEHRERKSAEMDALGTEPSRKEADYSQLRQQHKDLRRLYRGVTDKNLQLKDVTKQLTQELESMRTINNALEQELQACKDDLFKAQPSGTVPDSKVAQAYEDLHEHVSSWMEGEICRFDVNPQKDVRGPLPDLFHHGNNPAVKDFLSVHVISAGEYFVRCILHVLLHKLLFAEEILLLGLGKSETDLLRQVEQSLGEASPT